MRRGRRAWAYSTGGWAMHFTVQTRLLSLAFARVRKDFRHVFHFERTLKHNNIHYKRRTHKHTFFPLNRQPTKNNKRFLQRTNLHLFDQEVLQSWRPCFRRKIKKTGWVKASMQDSRTEWGRWRGEKRIQIAPGLESTYDAAGKLNWINCARKRITSNLRQRKQTVRKQD